MDATDSNATLIPLDPFVIHVSKEAPEGEAEQPGNEEFFSLDEDRVPVRFDMRGIRDLSQAERRHCTLVRAGTAVIMGECALPDTGVVQILEGVQPVKTANSPARWDEGARWTRF
jgi:hypothetical protein